VSWRPPALPQGLTSEPGEHLRDIHLGGLQQLLEVRACQPKENGHHPLAGYKRWTIRQDPVFSQHKDVSFRDRTGAGNLRLTARGSPYGSPLCVRSASSTSRTLCASASGVKGFCRKAVLSSTTPRRIRVSSE
jgi:hypothetical protein